MRNIGGFVPGTLIHVHGGNPIPIENLGKHGQIDAFGRRVAVVLSQPEDAGEWAHHHRHPRRNRRDRGLAEASGKQAYRQAGFTVRQDQQVYAVQVGVEGEKAPMTVIAARNQPFWVKTQRPGEKHWRAAESLQPGQILQLADGRKARVHAAGLIRRTQHENLVLAADDRAGVKMVFEITQDAFYGPLFSPCTVGNQLLPQEEPFLTLVYDLEVDEFHTYYAGEAGIWVHDTQYAAELNIIDERENGLGFADGTSVLVEGKGDFTYQRIESIDVGDRVLSRDAITGEMAFKRVLEFYDNGKREIFHIHVSEPNTWYGNLGPVETTPEHPFWVQGKGWTPACDLKPGDEFLTHDGRPITVDRVGMSTYRANVFTLEVEDFNTYFVETGIWVRDHKNRSSQGD
jgi:hypothetical protein